MVARQKKASPPASPFRASFGTNPPYLAGRLEALQTVRTGLTHGSWPQERAILLTGLRGVGKTVLLNEAEDIARAQGWQSLHITARPGIVDELAQTLLPELVNRLRDAPLRVPDSGGIAGASLHLAPNPTILDVAPSLRLALGRALDILDERHTGLFITVDEVNPDAASDLATLGTEFQHLAREGRDVAVIFAGVPENVDKLRHDRGLTFIRRAFPIELGLIGFDDARSAFDRPITENGRTASADVIDYMARAAQGYPFLVQLIGDLAWRLHPEHTGITLDDAKSAFATARRRMGSAVYEPSLSELSPVDRNYLAAMAQDEGPSQHSAVAERLGVERKYADMYRSRLIKARIIHAAGRGLVDFTVPYLRQYLRESQNAGAGPGAGGYPAPPPLDV